MMDFLKRPLLLEGQAGVGKTEVAKALAALHGAELIRLQCYEGLDQNAALYEWNYQRQLLAIKAREGAGEAAERIEEQIFSEKYLLERPLLAAIRRDKPAVLLVDEVDRADEEFEAFLLELLSDYQVVNSRTRDHRRRHHPARRADLEQHARTVGRVAPALPVPLRRLSRCRARGGDHRRPRARGRDGARRADRPRGRAIRREDLRKTPGVAETLDWAATLAGLGVEDLRNDPEIVHDTLICLLKTHEDRARLTREVTERLVAKVA